jgi:hypothetical protein
MFSNVSFWLFLVRQPRSRALLTSRRHPARDVPSPRSHDLHVDPLRDAQELRNPSAGVRRFCAPYQVYGGRRVASTIKLGRSRRRRVDSRHLRNNSPVPRPTLNPSMRSSTPSTGQASLRDSRLFGADCLRDKARHICQRFGFIKLSVRRGFSTWIRRDNCASNKTSKSGPSRHRRRLASELPPKKTVTRLVDGRSSSKDTRFHDDYECANMQSSIGGRPHGLEW